MRLIINSVYTILFLWILIYTISYCVFEFKNKNIAGALAVAALCIAVCIVPILVMIVL